MTQINKLYIFALAAQGEGLSGGDRIFIELARRWSKKFPITIYVTSEGRKMCERQNLNSGKNLRLEVVGLGWFERLGFLGRYIGSIVAGIKLGLSLSVNHNLPDTFVYNASEFWMDSFPSAILKFRSPKIKWIATWYQTAPNPIQGYSELVTSNKTQVNREVKHKFSALLYWLAQLPVWPLINKLADKVIVNNEDEKKRFSEHTKNGNTVVMIGAVPLADINSFLTVNTSIQSTKRYDAVFQGRFHPQKGVVEMIDIWKLVVNKIPTAKLVMIGDGPLMNNVKVQVSKFKLKKNVELLGYVFDGDLKYKTFAQSKLVVHPAYYDSGGMASAEAMAFGLPCVGFDLKSYESYYPKGMVKVPKGNIKRFSDAIVKLLEDNSYYKKISKEATELIRKSWSWDFRAAQILEIIEK